MKAFIGIYIQYFKKYMVISTHLWHMTVNADLTVLCTVASQFLICKRYGFIVKIPRSLWKFLTVSAFFFVKAQVYRCHIFSLFMNITCMYYYYYYYCYYYYGGRWMMSFFDCLSTFCFLLIRFHCIFSISYTILINFVWYYNYYCILIRIVRLSFFSSRASFTSFYFSLLTFCICFFILFHSCCSCVWVFLKSLMHEFHISCCHTEWYLLFFNSATTSTECVFGAKN